MLNRRTLCCHATKLCNLLSESDRDTCADDQIAAAASIAERDTSCTWYIDNDITTVY